jgi:uncharacterized protein
MRQTCQGLCRQTFRQPWGVAGMGQQIFRSILLIYLTSAELIVAMPHDTGPSVTLLCRNDTHHHRAIESFDFSNLLCCAVTLLLRKYLLLLKRSGFAPTLALGLNEREVVQLPFVHQEQIGSISSLFKHYENVPASLADATLIRVAEIDDSPLLLTTDSNFRIYRRHGRQTIPLVTPKL